MMKNLMTKILLPALGILLWLAICYPISKRPEGFNYFLFWILAGFPFGIRFMCLKLVPKSYGLTGAVGVFALNVVIGSLAGGVFLLMRVVRIVVDTVRIISGKEVI
jgi:hypothetical protein